MSKKRGDPLVSVRSINGKIEDDVTLRQIFLGEGWEVLTDELINQLVSDGWDRAGLIEHQREGAYYCRPRNSIIYSPVFSGFDDREWSD
jgi:hypothetical protein